MVAMSVRQITNEADLKKYDGWIRSNPDGNVWQSLEWKEYNEAMGKEVKIYICEHAEQIVASALVVVDRTSFGLSTWEIPRGPLSLMDNEQLTIDNLLSAILQDAQRNKCMSIYLSPPKPIVHCQLSIINSNRDIHCEATRVIGLTKTEEDILAQMKQKGRYNIKVAEKRGVVVKQSDDIGAFYKLVTETSARDGFTPLSKKQYETFLQDLAGSFLLLAYDKNNIPIGGLLGVAWGGKGIYYYGASSYAHRATMAPYLLQWEAMRFCKAEGATMYDLLGISPPKAGTDHPWSGISAFKEKFGGEIVAYPPEQKIVLRPVVDWLIKMKRTLH